MKECNKEASNSYKQKVYKATSRGKKKVQIHIDYYTISILTYNIYNIILDI